eukprot:4526426-Pleurochrysis_carterae.AAC.1
MNLSGLTREREAYDQRSTGSTGNTRGKRVPATVSVGLSSRTLASVSAARSSLVPSNGDRLRRLRSSSSNSASRHA